MFKTCYRQGRLAVLFLTLLTLAGPAFAQNTTVSDADFDGNGEVGLSDFLLFVDVFGTSSGDANYNAKFDLDGNGEVGLPDFLVLADDEVSPTHKLTIYLSKYKGGELKSCSL